LGWWGGGEKSLGQFGQEPIVVVVVVKILLEFCVDGT